jgi:hypothetical protein
MATMYGNILFDPRGFPIDQLENRLEREDTNLIPVLQKVLSTGLIEQADRLSVSRLLAIQICRYPEEFKKRLAPGQLLAIELLGIKNFADAAEFNSHLQSFPSYANAGTTITPAEFQHFTSLLDEQLNDRIEYFVNDHFQSQEGLNPNSVIDAAGPIAAHLAVLEWELLECPHPAFILSDRPMPLRIEGPFSLGLGARYALGINTNKAANSAPVAARLANPNEIDAVNDEVQSRADIWLCGPKPFLIRMEPGV